MARQVQIGVRGLALCFIKNSRWNVIFVSDPAHPLTLIDPAGTITRLRRGSNDLVCEFSATRVPNSGAIHFPATGIPNMSAPYAHGVDAQNRSNLHLTRRNNWNTGRMELELPASTMRLAGATADDCWIQEVIPGGGGGKTNLGTIATKLVFDFAIASDALNALSVTVTHRGTGDVYSDTFPKTASTGPLVFDFENGCGNDCTRNDSIDLYDIFKDKRAGTEKQFVSGAIRNGEVPGSDPTAPLAPAGIVTTVYGNCDPVGSEPPPGP